MNKLKVKAVISCDTCGCKLKREKTISVCAQNEHDARLEASKKVDIWRSSLIGKSCKVCDSIKKDMAA